MVKFLQVLPTLALATAAAAAASGAPKILRPGGNVWWVAQSQNELIWDCKDTSHPEFTVLVANKDTNLLTAPIAVIAQQQNYVCSLTVPQNQANQPAGTGWTILFANPLNNTDVWSTSDEFEIKALGSEYPPKDDSTASASASGSSTSTGRAASATTNAAVSLKSGLGVVGLAALGVAVLMA